MSDQQFYVRDDVKMQDGEYSAIVQEFENVRDAVESGFQKTWNVTEGSSSPTVLCVDALVGDDTEGDGIGVPFKTVQAAVNAVASAGDNSSSKPYVIDIAPGVYPDNIVLEDPSLAFISFMGSGINSTRITGNIQSSSNNTNLSSVYFHRLLVSGTISFVGDGSNFGGDLEFSYCVCTGTSLFESLITAGFKNSKIDQDITFTNVTMGWLSSGEGQNPGRSLNVNFDDSKPGSSPCYVIVENALCGTVTTQQVGATGAAIVQFRNGTRAASLVNGASCTAVLYAGVAIQGALTNSGTISSTPETYIDGTAGAWGAPAPANVRVAIDRLATAVTGLLAAPIP